MSWRNYTILIFIFSLSLASYAQNNSTETKLENLPREKSEALDKNWEVVPSLKTVSKKKFKGKKEEVHHHSDDDVFVKKTRDKTKPLLNVDNEDESYVVYNPKRKTTGTVSGAIIINLRQPSDLDNLLKDYPLKKIRLEKELSIGIVKVKKGNDISKVYNDLKKDNRVKQVEVEVISNKMKPL